MTDDKRQGFQTMDKARHRSVASRGGKTAHERGNAHEYTSDEAIAAGRLGGLVVSQDREHMAELGRKGAAARKARKEQQHDHSTE